jgi:hypothetical protein
MIEATTLILMTMPNNADQANVDALLAQNQAENRSHADGCGVPKKIDAEHGPVVEPVAVHHSRANGILLMTDRGGQLPFSLANSPQNSAIRASPH